MGSRPDKDVCGPISHLQLCLQLGDPRVRRHEPLHHASPALMPRKIAHAVGFGRARSSFP
jgi:hypothetical protein